MNKQLPDPRARQYWRHLVELREKQVRGGDEFKRMAHGHNVHEWAPPHIHEPHEGWRGGSGRWHRHPIW